MNVREQFHNLVTRLQPVRFRDDPVPQPSPDEVLAAELHDWAAHEHAQDEFLPWLAEQIERIELDKMAVIDSHPRMTYHEGRKDFARFIESKFHEWSGTRPKAPRQKE